MPQSSRQIVELLPGAAVGPQIHRILRDRIVRGHLMPGARISETELAAEYAVSRQPVREAFIKLAEENLLEIRPQRGTFVRRISLPAVLSAQFVREAVEADIVRILAVAPSPELITRLEGLLQEQIATANDPDPTDFVVLDESFHRAMAEAIGQAPAADILEGLKIQLNRTRHLTARQFSRHKVIEQHSAILDALRARDPDRASAMMRTHLQKILNDLPAIVEAMPECFDQTTRKTSA
ncbi:GntR family transcriptional regulator [Roseinatronobacter alkalisoli]|uniref:GntR family transcriptional regulator n=1 Tax=Roseinatronobacter alkalisoli TaxID=3028235 RepID=A0ABT5TE03_9RHOB|nr:GntR family transcriptional regulator [Roseinatronobacter sp. HJB301]MDD7973345.1 GntR family transcriptional regulator [Roseinatronobacter sp. HJB301]